MRTRSTRWPIASVALAAMLLAGCASPGGSEEAAPDDDVLVAGMLGELSNADPAIGISGSDYPYLYAMYDRLVHFDPETLELLPDAGLAAEWGFVNEDMTVFELTLKPDVTFHDGTDLDAEAVKFSMERLKELGINRDLDLVNEIEAVDDLTVRLELERPYSVLPAVLSDRAGMIMSTKAIEEHGESAGEHSAGTGPFELTEWARGEKIELTRYDDYYRDDEPKLAGLRFRVFDEPASMTSALQTGEIHYAGNVDTVNADLLRSVDSLKVVPEMTMGARLIQLNYAVEPMNDQRVRKALELAIDRQAIIDAVYGPDSGAVPVNQAVPETLWAHSDLPVEHDVERAKKLLAEAGHGDGLTLNMCFMSVEGSQEPDIYRAQFAEVGVTLDTTVMPNVSGCVEGLTNGTFHMFMVGWSGRPDPYLSYSALLGPYQFGEPDYSEATDLLAEVLTTTEIDEQKALYDQLNEFWVEQVPHILVYTNPNLVVYDARIDGSAEDLQGKPDLSGLSFG